MGPLSLQTSLSNIGSHYHPHAGKERPGRPKYTTAISTHRLSAVSREVGPTSTIERRSADIAVIGDSAVGYLTAYSLARRGKKVILLPSYGLSAPSVPPAPLQPLKLTHPQGVAVHLAAESAQYWRGVELLAQAPLLQACPSLDVVLHAEREHEGAKIMELIQGACEAQGLELSMLNPEEMRGRCLSLQLPPGAAGLWQREAAVIRAPDMTAAVATLARRAGVMVKEGLQLRGWRDQGSYFQVKASTALQPDLMSEFEVEQLLLAPGEWNNTCCAMFGISWEGLQTREVVELRVEGNSNHSQLPLWTYWGAPHSPDTPATSLQSPDPSSSGSSGAPGPNPSSSKRTSATPSPSQNALTPGAGAAAEITVTDSRGRSISLLGVGRSDSPAVAAVAGGLPLLPGATRLSLLQLPGSGQPVLQPFNYSPWGTGQTLANMLGLGEGDDDDDAALRKGSGSPAAGVGGRAGRVRLSAPQAAAVSKQQQQAWSRHERQLLAGQVLGLHAAASRVVKGLGEVLEGRCYSRLHAATADGLPLLGYHPGYEAGRVVVAVAAAGQEVWGAGASATAGSWQLSPMVAKLAGDLLMGVVPAAATTDDDDDENDDGSVSPQQVEGRRNAAAAAAGSVRDEPGAEKQQQQVVAGGKQQTDSSGSTSCSQDVFKALGLGRKGVGLRVQGLLEGVDPWDGLQAMQQAARVSKMEVEQQQDEGEDARRMQKGDVV